MGCIGRRQIAWCLGQRIGHLVQWVVLWTLGNGHGTLQWMKPHSAMGGAQRAWETAGRAGKNVRCIPCQADRFGSQLQFQSPPDRVHTRPSAAVMVSAPLLR